MTTRYRLERQVTAAHFGHSWYFGVVRRRVVGRVRQAPGCVGEAAGAHGFVALEGRDGGRRDATKVRTAKGELRKEENQASCGGERERRWKVVTA
jgi:hypothetical protein